MKPTALILCTSLAISTISAPVDAGEGASVAVWVGQFNVSGRLDPGEVGVAWRSRPRAWKLQTEVGGLLHGDGGGFLFAGARRDFGFGSRFGLTVELALGLYEPGDGLDLGGPIQLRSGIELFVDVTERSRLGASFVHHSNGGLYSDNPGANSVALVYARRLD